MPGSRPPQATLLEQLPAVDPGHELPLEPEHAVQPQDVRHPSCGHRLVAGVLPERGRHVGRRDPDQFVRTPPAAGAQAGVDGAEAGQAGVCAASGNQPEPKFTALSSSPNAGLDGKGPELRAPAAASSSPGMTLAGD